MQKLLIVLLLSTYVFGTVLNAAEETLGETMARLNARTKEEAEKLKHEDIGSQIYQKAQGIGEYLKETTDDVVEGVSNTYESTKDTFSSTYDKIKHKAEIAYYGEQEKTAYEQISEKAGEFYDSASHYLNSAYQSASEEAEDLYNQAMTKLTGEEYKSKREAESAYNTAQRELGEAFHSVKDSLWHLYLLAKDKVAHEETTFEKIQRKAYEAKEAIKETYDQAVGNETKPKNDERLQYLFDTYDSAVKKLAEQYENIKQTLSSQYERLNGKEYQEMLE